MSVMINSVSPSANATSVFGLSNSTSPMRLVTICVVIVVARSKGLNVRFARSLLPSPLSLSHQLLEKWPTKMIP